MKRLERKNRAIDHVRLLADFSKSKGIQEYTQRALQEFGDEASRELASFVTQESRLTGIRAEAMFLAVVAGLGKVGLIKAEDEGEVYYQGPDIQSPDYRIVLADKSALLVEVKAHRMKNIRSQLKLGDTYVQQLRRYADMMKTELRFAIYWDGLRTWTLNPLEAFEAGSHGKKWSLDFGRAYGASEMAVLGDRFIATPAPLRFRVNVDPDKSDRIPPSGGPMNITIARVELLSRERALSGKAADIAWKLLWHGNWVDAGQHVEQDGDRVLWIDHLFGPTEDEEDWGKGCEMIGSCSGIISNAYLSGAERTVHTTSKSGVLEPGAMGQFIPDDFMKLELPLALIHLQSNLKPAKAAAKGGTRRGRRKVAGK